MTRIINSKDWIKIEDGKDQQITINKSEVLIELHEYEYDSQDYEERWWICRWLGDSRFAALNKVTNRWLIRKAPGYDTFADADNWDLQDKSYYFQDCYLFETSQDALDYLQSLDFETRYTNDFDQDIIWSKDILDTIKLNEEYLYRQGKCIDEPGSGEPALFEPCYNNGCKSHRVISWYKRTWKYEDE